MRADNSAPGLAARVAAQTILQAVLGKRRTLDATAEAALAKAKLSPRDAGFARAIAGETLRRFGQIEALLRHFVSKPLPPHRSGPTLEILMAALCELLFLKSAPHAAIDAANRLCARDNKAVHFKPLVNAVLRRASVDGAGLVAQQDAARLNTPDWLWQRWENFYGSEATRAIAQAHQDIPPLDLALRDETGAAPSAAFPLFGKIARLSQPGPVENLDGYAQGAWWIQDAAASLPARLFGTVRGKRVIDLCAAPGGKTAQLAASGADVTAVDIGGERLARVRENLRRLKLDAQLVEADIRDWRPNHRAECVLLDAPCSATGTIRRHPDLPWIKSAADVISCAQTAGDLLDAASDMVASGGCMVFAVCSLEPEEGEEQIAAFLARNDNHFARQSIMPAELFGHSEWITPDGDLRTLPCHLAEQGGMDGFYAARLVRL